MGEDAGRLALRGRERAVVGLDREILAGLHRLGVLALGQLARGQHRLRLWVVLLGPQLPLLGPDVGGLAGLGAALGLGLTDLVFGRGPALGAVARLDLAGLGDPRVLSEVGDLGAGLLGDLAIDVGQIVGVFVGLRVVELVELLDHLHVLRERLDLLGRRLLGLGLLRWIGLGLGFLDLGLGLGLFDLGLDDLPVRLFCFDLGLRLGLLDLGLGLGRRIGLGQLDDQNLFVFALERLGLEQRDGASDRDEVGHARPQ
ncbi:hypothetical protein ENSA7_08240 [Enhygromyxa salina]|uniref:Uncharacterized protein n=1 Tax=Enhygromyxa salina TaxID=215803 RepID=A0A2S9YWN0_9BACT|nr:hypothetical protein ENSA7_08240 [Enhygromyxa salina]